MDDSGQNSVEYGLLIAGIVVLVLLGVALWGGVLHDWFAGLAASIVNQGLAGR